MSESGGEMGRFLTIGKTSEDLGKFVFFFDHDRKFGKLVYQCTMCHCQVGWDEYDEWF